MKTAGSLKLIRCITRLVTPICLASCLILIISCGNAKVLAEGAIKQAETVGEKMRSGGAPEDMTIAYRLQMHNAQAAMKKKRYKVAQQEAQAATEEAERIIKKREAIAENAQERIKVVWNGLEHIPFPRKLQIEGCFAAQKAFDNKDYEKALQIASDLESRLRVEAHDNDRVNVVIQAPFEYFRQNEYIPVYETATATGLSGQVLEKIKLSTNAVFIESKFASPDVRFVKVTFMVNGVQVTGWVEGRFVY